MSDDVLWSCWAGDDLHRARYDEINAWVCEQGLDPRATRGIEVVVIDMPCLRIHTFALNAEDERYLELGIFPPEIAMAPPTYRAMRTPPPGYPIEETA